MPTSKSSAKVKLSFAPKKASKKLIKDLQERMQTVLTERYGLENGVRKTLESIGERYSITRERVRQIENAALTAIRKSESFAEAQVIFDEVRELIASLGGIVNEQEFFEMVYPNDVANQNNLHFLLVLGDDFEKVKGNKIFHDHWQVDTQIASNVRAILREVHDSLTVHDLLEEAELIDRIMNHKSLQNIPEHLQTPEHVRRWLDVVRAISSNQLGHWGLSRSSNISTRGVKDYAYLTLHQHGSPMHFREIAQAISDQFGRPVHVATCHNTLIADSRFILIGRGLYGLKEWGYEPGSARDVIRRVLEKAGTPLSKNEIIEAVKKERYLKDNTILVNLQNTKYFEKSEDGRYTLK